MPDENDVPLMFRAQVQNRCQLQYVKSGDCQKWTDEWISVVDKAGENPAPAFEHRENFESKEYNFPWRFVTNGGQDDGIIRPVIGTLGLPFYPGSSMKGAFCQACTEEQKQRYRLNKHGDEPSLLRFHGGYPVNNWKDKLVDIVHPQQDFQVKSNADHGAYALISLYKPKINFGISSQLVDTDWKEIWEIWEKALGAGIGCRVSSGYGQTNKITGDVLYEVKLHGQGAASKLLDNRLEFRPNIFRSGLRGHALRIFGGLNQALAEDIVDELFGGIRSGKEKVGLLGMAFVPDSPEWRSADRKDAYDVTGNLIWRLSGKLEKSEHSNLSPEQKLLVIKQHRDNLVELVKKLTQFAMLLGGFGKSWRRADHRIFYPKYTKHLIGCHWNWANDRDNQIRTLDHAGLLIQQVQEVAKKWMETRGFEVKQLPAVTQSPLPVPVLVQDDSNKPKLKRPGYKPPIVQQTESDKKDVWREAWQKDNVQVWGRIADNSIVIPWLHFSEISKNNMPNDRGYDRDRSKKPLNHSNSLALQRPDKRSNQNARPVIYRTSVTGRVKDKKKSDEPTQIGRLWHRMYPVANLVQDANNLNNTNAKPALYWEFLAIFPDNSDEFNNFLTFLQAQPGGFTRLW